MFLEPSIISIVLAKLRGGKLINLENVNIRGWYLFIISAIIQILLSFSKKMGLALGNLTFEDYFVYFHALSYLLMVICIIINIKRSYMKLFLIGIILNFLVIFSNGGQMPVSLEGVKGINNEVEIEERDYDIKHKSINKDTKFIYLSDIILIPPPYPLPKILSIGDLFLMAGVFVFFQEEMIIKRRSYKSQYL